MQEHSAPASSRSKGIYLLPNLFTTAGIFAGFFAIVKAMHGHFEIAAIAIFIAMITDALDGRVARLTKTQTSFGAEYDSLSDMVAFGVAPSLVIYEMSLIHLGKLGWLAAFIFTAAGALRLARFNSQLKGNDKVKHNDKTKALDKQRGAVKVKRQSKTKDLQRHYFQGLPITSGAGLIAAVIWFITDYSHINQFGNVIIALITVLTAAAMVSNLPYRSFKELDVKESIPFVALLIIVLVFVAIALDPPTVLCLLLFGYALSGPVAKLWDSYKHRHKGSDKAQTVLPQQSATKPDEIEPEEAKPDQAKPEQTKSGQAKPRA